MTIFAGRAHAIEAHDALTQLVSFRDRFRRRKETALRFATRIGLRGVDAERFAIDLAERSIIALKSEVDFAGPYIDSISCYPDSLRLVDHADVKHQEALPPKQLSWAGFVLQQVLLIFAIDGFSLHDKI